MFRGSTSVLALILILIPATLLAQEPPQSAAEGAEQLRTLYLGQDFVGGSDLADYCLERWSGDPDLTMWAVANYARNTRGDEAVSLAEALVADQPDDPMSHVALAFALRYQTDRSEDALAAADEAMELAPDNRYAVWVKAFVLHGQREYAAEVEFLDEHIPNVEPWSELIVQKGNALLSQRYDDSEKLEEGLAALAEAREMDPGNHNAHYFAAAALLNSRRVDEALPLFERCLEISPYATTVRSYYWNAINSMGELTQDERKARIAEDADRLRAERGFDHQILRTVANGYEMAGRDDAKAEVEEEILTEHPRTASAEWVLVDRTREYRSKMSEGEVEDSVAAVAVYRSMLKDLLDRTPHELEFIPGEMYRNLFYSYRDDEGVPDEEFIWAAKGMADNAQDNPSTQASVAVALADRGIGLEMAEEMANNGLEMVDEYMSGIADAIDDIGEAAEYQDRLNSTVYDALAWVQHKAGRTEEAQENFDKAIELSTGNSLPYYHMGQIAEEQGDYEAAMSHYAEGRGHETYGATPNHDALEEVYAKVHGSMDGYEAYVEELDAIIRERRQAEIAETRYEDPEPLDAFELENLAGELVSIEDTRGKITVINFWGTWCGPCRSEAPQLQEFHEKYKDHPEVMFLTISNDDNPEMVIEWMGERELDYPVLMDDGYVTDVGIRAWPTTWFMNKDGLIEFEHIGANNTVFEDFSFRVELLLGEGQ